MTDVLTRRGVDFIGRAARRRRPFFLELASFAPHSPYVPAPRNADDFPGLTAPHPPSFDVLPSHAPLWLAAHRRLSARQIARIDQTFRRRAQSVEAVDRMIAQIEEALHAHGLSGNTYIVFSSDNGLHTGEYRLMPGKLTAFDTDIHVPLIVAGPGVPAGATTPAMAENIDLAPTFAAIGGATLSGDGTSLMPLLSAQGQTEAQTQAGTQPPADWRNAVLVEHRGSRLSVLDPDFQQSSSGSPTTYEAMRTRAFLYVEYADGEREFYDLRSDPFELRNVARRLTGSQRRLLHAQLTALSHCHGEQQCWAAMHLDPTALAPLP
jgi:arylsulfatase A-like enzyme